MLVVFYACKKEQKSQVISAGSQTSYDAILQFQKSTYLEDDTVLYRNARTNGSFYDSAVSTSFYGAPHGIDVGQVSINGVTLEGVYSPNFNTYDYYDSTYTIYSTPMVVNISGGNGFAPGGFTVNEDFPVYYGYKLLPDTIHYGTDSTIMIPVSGYAGCDKVYAAISDAWGGSPYTGSHPLQPGKQYALIHTYELYNSPFSLGTAYIQINLFKTRYVKFGGKNCVITYSHTYYRSVFLIPD